MSNAINGYGFLTMRRFLVIVPYDKEFRCLGKEYGAC
jgi:hypothetical protein